MKKRILSVLLSLVMVVGLLPTTALAADKVDMSTYTGNRITHIVVKASVDNTKVPGVTDSYAESQNVVVGESGYNYKIKFELESLTYQTSAGGTQTISSGFPISMSAGLYYRGSDGAWVGANIYQMPVYLAGDYRYTISAAVTSDYLSTYRIDPSVTVTVNWDGSGKSENCIGTKWICNEENRSVINAHAHYFEITDNGSVRIIPSSVSIPAGYVGETIKSFSMASWASGGQAPYTFSKVSGPDGIDISADGTVSGAPTTASAATTLTIKVTDANGDDATADIPVGEIKTHKLIKTVEIGGLYHPHVGDDPENNQPYIISVKDTDGNVIQLEDCPLYVDLIMSNWKVRIGANWGTVKDSFEAGRKYRYGFQLRIDGETNREGYGLAKDLTVTVQGLDGVDFTVGTIYSGSTYAYTYVYSDPMNPLTAQQTLTGTISYVGAARLHEPLNARVNDANTDSCVVKWQYSYTDGKSWQGLSTGNSITLNASSSSLMGKLIRAVAYSTDNYSGMIYGAPLTVEKGWNMGIPTSPKLEYDSDSSTLTVTDDSYNAEQEYRWATSPAKDPTTGSAVWPVIKVGTGKTLSDVTPGTTYYVYTRFKETDTREAGRILGVAKYTVPTISGSTGTISATDLTYPAYGEDGGNGKWTPTIYLKKGEHITVEYQLSPNNANANLPQWNGTYTTTDSSGASVTVTNDDTNKTLTITAGDKTGTVNVTAYKNGAHTELWQYGTDHSADGRKITVKIYDPTDLSTVPFPYLPVDLGEVTLYAGDTYTVTKDMMKNALDLPAGVNKSGYNYSAYIKREDVTTGAPNVGTTALDGSVEVADNVLTAKKVGSATVYVFARTDDTVLTNAGQGGYFAYFTVNVKERPAVLDFSVTPPVLTLQAGNTYQLTAAKTPADDSDTFTWSSDNAAVTVDSTGKVTAVSAGKATITAKCGDAEATCTVTVLPACTTHSYIYQEKDWGHVKVCGLCGYTVDVVLPHDLCWYENAPTAGQMYGECVDCGYTTTPVDMTTTPTPAPTPGGSSVSTYTITVKDAKNGDVTADRKSASSGTTVTVTVDPDKGYTLETLTVLDKNGKEVKLTDKGNGKYTFKMPASKVTVTATFMDDNTMLNFFVDVPTDAYFADAVLWAAENGITGGIDATHFAPYATCTRAQAVTFLWRAAGCPAPRSSEMPFTDVPSGSYCYDAVLWAVENGITKGTTETTFTPNAECSRAQIVTFLWRSQKSPAIDAANPFTDVSAEAYYASAVLWAAANGITGGTTATTFSPNANCTRAQIVTFIYRCMK